MKEIIIGGEETGIRLDKFLEKLLPHAGRSFLYKMLRKKNITLNGKKAEGSERLCAHDKICIFFSDETYAQFCRGADSEKDSAEENRPLTPAAAKRIAVIYEDHDMLIADKPAGLLTQRAAKTDYSLNDWLCEYVGREENTETGRLSYTPSAVNRLDRNTSGLVLCAKTYRAARTLSGLIRDRRVGKYYLALVKGHVTKPQTLHGFLTKDPIHNRVSVRQEGPGEEIHTKYLPLSYLEQHDMTLLSVRLITGKPHQIRAHLADISHPVCGDPKYGDARLNRELKEHYRINRQLLHAFALSFPENTRPGEALLAVLAGKTISAPPPQDFRKLLDACHIGETLWQRGIQEDFAVPPLRI